MCGRGRARPLCLRMEPVWLRLDARKWKPFGGGRNGDISEFTPAVRSRCLHCVRRGRRPCLHGFWPRSADRREGPAGKKFCWNAGAGLFTPPTGITRTAKPITLTGPSLSRALSQLGRGADSSRILTLRSYSQLSFLHLLHEPRHRFMGDAVQLSSSPAPLRHGRIREDAPCRPQAFALPWGHDDEGKKAADDAPMRRC